MLADDACRLVLHHSLILVDFAMLSDSLVLPSISGHDGISSGSLLCASLSASLVSTLVALVLL